MINCGGQRERISLNSTRNDEIPYDIATKITTSLATSISRKDITDEYVHVQCNVTTRLN